MVNCRIYSVKCEREQDLKVPNIIRCSELSKAVVESFWHKCAYWRLIYIHI